MPGCESLPVSPCRHAAAAPLPRGLLACLSASLLAFLVASLLACLLLAGATAQAQEPLRIGSKRFTESYVLAEVLAQTARAHAPVEVRQGLGNTAIVQAALRAGSIDLYVEYTGTIDREILKNTGASTIAALRAQLAPLGLGVAVPLGFGNGYALAVRAATQERLGIRKLSDLAGHPALRLGLSNEFIGRADGWRGLAERYRLPQQPIGLDHGLAAQALADDRVDAIDIYTTDARIDSLGLRVLADDAGFFPRYDAVLIYRLDLPSRFPAAWAALQRLEGTIDETRMIAMNARAELQGAGFETIAADHLAGRTADSRRANLWDRLVGPDLARLTVQHLALVGAAVALAMLVGVPLAAAVAPHARARSLVLGLTGLLQTVPSLAMLAVLIPLVGQIGAVPAMLALTLYALLPIMRNTCAGLAEVSPGLRQAGLALGLTPFQVLRHIALPLALPVIVAGARTATTISVGTATVAAFIGAGGFGERIVTGLALNDRDLLLAGAIPAAALALGGEAVFGWLEGRLRRAR